MPSGYHLGCKTKTPIDSHTVRSQSALTLALASRLWLWCWLIFTIVSRLQCLQNKGKSVKAVVGRILTPVACPHFGQTILFPCKSSLAQGRPVCNCFCKKSSPLS